MIRVPKIYTLLVTVAATCVGFVTCKPAVESTITATPKHNLNYDPSTVITNLKNSLENFLGNKTDIIEKKFTNKSVNESINRRPISTNPEHEHIGNEKESMEGMFFDTADWVKEAEKWTFKGGDWGLVTLPDDDHPDIPTPPVPGPVLLAEGNSMGKVIVSRSETNVENLTLHFSYFLSNNPANPPELEVYQIKDNTHSERVSVEATYGQWTTSTIKMPYSGNFEIKFIGRRIVDANEIALDDIVLRGYYMQTNEDNEDYYSDYYTDNYSVENDDVKSTESPVIILNLEDNSEDNKISENIDEAGSGGGFIIFTLVSIVCVCFLGLLYWRSRGRWEDDEVPIYSRDARDDYESPIFQDQEESNEDDSLTAKLQNYKSID